MSETNEKVYQIFGTPPEPLFNRDGNCAPPDLLEDWLIKLARDNASNINEATVKQGLFSRGRMCELVFLTCEKFDIPTEAKYQALDIFGQFMTKHIEELYNYVLSSKSTNPQREWQTILEKIRKQLSLRIISCCQVASKLTSHYQVITATRAKRVLIDTGHHYTCDSILKSELRILKTLNFQVGMASPVVHIETILEILGHNDPSLKVKLYHSVSLKLLDLVYIHKAEVYKRLYQVAAGEQVPSLEESTQFVAVEADKILLAVGVISAATYIVDQLITEKVTDQLSKVTRILREDIIDFATVLIQIIMER